MNNNNEMINNNKINNNEINNNENFGSFGGYTYTNNEQTLSAFSEILQETALKVGCCNRNSNDNGVQYANVRVPIDLSNPEIASEYKYNYKFQTIKIPAGTCPIDTFKDSHICNAFYDVYCQNIFKTFSETNLPKEQLLDYAPECACYIPKTESQLYYPDGTPASCYKPGCSLTNTQAYLDTVSRNKPCNLKICQNIFNANNIVAGGNVTIDPILQNSCGEYLNQPVLPSNINYSSNTHSASYYYTIIIIFFILLCLSSILMKK